LKKVKKEIDLDIGEWIINELGSHDKKLEFDELLHALGPEEDPAAVRETVGQLISQGKVLRSKKGKLFLPGRFGLYTGRLDVKRSGFAFLPDIDGDIFISADNKGGAMHGDLVVVRQLLAAETDRKREGEVVEILEEKQTRLVGTLMGRYVRPDDERLDEVRISKKDVTGAKDGQKVVVDIKKRARKGESAEGSIVEVLGKAGLAQVELKSLIRQYELPEEFPDEVQAEAEHVASRKISAQGREDWRDRNVFTIDGADAKDLDDAVSIQRLENGWELGVHIADVAQYVTEGSKLDKEALKRGTSVYLADTVIPMLPKALSNGVCSLSAGTDKLTLSCIMTLDARGQIIDSRQAQSIIRSKHRLTYSDVNALFDGDEALREKYADILEDLLEMRELALILRRLREEKGSIDFDLEESAFKYDEKGRVTGVGPRDRGEAERLIEEFMLAANKTVAETYYWRQLPFVYRVHEQPDEEKMQIFLAFYSNFGKVKGKMESIHPKALQGILNDVKGTPHENIINQILLRSLKKAEYSPECKGHFGLSFPYYCHFTSPIRRYPDLAVHRVVKSDLSGRMTKKAVEAMEARVSDISRQSSIRERVAMEAERAADDMKKAEFMYGKEGQEFEGVVSGVSRNVFFVELDNTVEGVIPLSSLQDDYYVYNEKMYCVVGERTRRRISLGDEMRVRLVSVSVYPPRIEFEPVR
jgi:ribonuclease R